MGALYILVHTGPKTNRQSGAFDIILPIQLKVNKIYFLPPNYNLFYNIAPLCAY